MLLLGAPFLLLEIPTASFLTNGMKFKYLLFFSLLVASLQAASVADLTFSINNDFTEFRVSDCQLAASGSLEIPSTYQGLPVTSIGSGAFQDCTSLTSINIPDSVISIGVLAFYNCTSLTNITLPDSILSIGRQAFLLSSLSYIDIDGLTYLFSDSYAFLIDGSSASGDLSLPNVDSRAVRIIGYAAFSQCTGLTSVIIPDSVISIEGFAFQGCTSLTSATIGNSVTNIGTGVFSGCTSLTDVSLNSASANLILAGPEFYNYVTSINISEGTVQIADDAFYNCYKVTNIIIPDSVTSIGNEAFRFCSGLTSITFEGPPPAFNISTLTDTNSEPILYYKAFPQMYSVYKETYNLPMVYLGPPTIDVQPQGAIASIGETVNLSVSATDVESSQLSYQWMRNGVDLSQETAASLSITSIASTDSGSYQVKVSNTAGTTTSEAASVTLVASDLYTQQQFDTALSSGFALGVSTVQDNAANYGLVAEENIEDARAGSSSIQVTNGTATLQLQIERSEDLSNWTSHQDDLISIPLQINADSQFFRFAIP